MKKTVTRILTIPGMISVIFRHAFTVFILLLFLAGTTGISARKHICSSSKKVTITVFPELANPAGDCCCATAEGVSGFSNGPDDQCIIDGLDCCKTLHLYFKAAFVSLPLQFSYLQIPVTVSEIPSFNVPPRKELSDNPRRISYYTDTGPPISGRQRILAQHQSKIPNPHLTVS